MKIQEMNLNIRYDAPKIVWSKHVPTIYEKMEGWLGYGNANNQGDDGFPYWFSFNEDETEKYISASVEPSGLHFTAYMTDDEWEKWKKEIKLIASEILEYKVGEIELGEVDY